MHFSAFSFEVTSYSIPALHDFLFSAQHICYIPYASFGLGKKRCSKCKVSSHILQAIPPARKVLQHPPPATGRRCRDKVLLRFPFKASNQYTRRGECTGNRSMDNKNVWLTLCRPIKMFMGGQSKQTIIHRGTLSRRELFDRVLHAQPE